MRKEKEYGSNDIGAVCVISDKNERFVALKTHTQIPFDERLKDYSEVDIRHDLRMFIKQVYTTKERNDEVRRCLEALVGGDDISISASVSVPNWTKRFVAKINKEYHAMIAASWQELY